ncbi:MAG: CoA transferase, partial [Chloroflexota bacterium]
GTEDGRNVMPQRGYGDANAAIHAAVAILLALHHRAQTGRGQWIDVGEVETASVLLGEPFADYFMNGRVATPRGTYHPAMAPHNIYPCEGDDAWVAIAVTGEQEWRSLCKAIGRADIADQPAFADAVPRVRNRKELDGIVSAWTRQKTPRDAADALQAAGVAAEPVMNAHDHYFDPGFNHRKAWVEVEHPILGNITLPAVPWRLSDTPCKITGHAPTLGQHNGYVCRDLLGVPQERVDELAARKVLQ